MSMAFEALREAIRARASPPAPQPAALAAARALAAAGGASVLGIVFFGSRRTQAGCDPWSAYDFFVLTRDYQSFYRRLRAGGALSRSPTLHAALNAVLPPSQLSFRTGSEGGFLHAKCAVITLTTLLREASGKRRDHFCIGRLFQPTEILYAESPAVREQILDALVNAYSLTYSWGRPWLPPRFDADAYGRTLLRVSLRGEIRAEPAGRAEALWEAQRPEQAPLFRLLLRELAARGDLVEADEPGRYALARAVSLGERVRWRAYFAWSKVRATIRWFKYVLTFEGWLDYILRKARRHGGEEIVLAPHERRMPLLFLWPRLFRHLREKDKKGGGE